MPNIIPVSDLRNYNEVLHLVSADEPVFLTKNGRGKFALVDIETYEKLISTVKLLSALKSGERSGDEKGWFSLEDVETELGINE